MAKLKIIHSPLWGHTRSGKPRRFVANGAVDAHPNPRQLQPHEYVGNGMSIKQLLAATEAEIADRAHDVTIKNYNSTVKTAGGFPAVSTVTVSHATSSRSPPQQHKCLVVGLSKDEYKPVAVNWTKFFDHNQTYLTSALRKIKQCNTHKQLSLLTGMLAYCEQHPNVVGGREIMPLVTTYSELFPKVNWSSFAPVMHHDFTMPEKRLAVRLLKAAVQHVQTTYSDELTRAKFESLSLQKRVKVFCNCENYCFVWEYANTAHGASQITYSNGDPPATTNPALRPGLCKHLVATVREIIKNRD